MRVHRQIHYSGISLLVSFIVGHEGSEEVFLDRDDQNAARAIVLMNGRFIFCYVHSVFFAEVKKMFSQQVQK